MPSPAEIKRKYNVKTQGVGEKTLLFAHGFGCDQNMWRFLLPSFENDYKIILYDQMGAGNSDISTYDENKYSDLRGYSEDVIEIIEGLDLKNVVFVGHSVSAMIGILAAIKRPELFSDLILIGPSPCYFNDGSYQGGFPREALEELLSNANKDYLGWARAMAPAIMARPDRPEFGAELTNSFCRTNPTIAQQFARVLFLSDNRSDISRLTTPSLILQCSQDIVAPETVGRYMHAQIKNSSFYILRAIGHCPHVSEPDETATAILAYLRKQAAQAA